MKRSKQMTGRDFDRLSAAEKEHVYQSCEAIGPADGQPLSEAELARHRRIARKAGPPRVGQGAMRINVTVERGLLKAADRFARSKGMSRAEMIAAGLRQFVKAG